MRVVSDRRSLRNEKSAQESDIGHDGESEEKTAPFGMSDIRVWDRRSPYDEVLDEIARKLVDVYSRLWAEASRSTAEKEQLPNQSLVSSQSAERVVEESEADAGLEVNQSEVDWLSHDLAGVMVCVRDALSANLNDGQDSTRRSPSNVDNTLHAKDGRTARGTTSLIATQQLRKVRNRLALVTDRLRASNKEKRDLLDALQRNRLDPTVAESLQAMLNKEKEKNVHLQSVIDEMFHETTRNKK